MFETGSASVAVSPVVVSPVFDAPVSGAPVAGAPVPPEPEVVLRRLDRDGPDPLPGGPELAAVLGALDPAVVSDERLVDVIGAFERVASWAAAGQAAAIEALAVRRLGEPGPEWTSMRLRQVAEEVSLVLAVSRVGASWRLGLAGGLARWPAVAGALGAGWIDVAKAAALLEAVEDLPAELAEAVLGQGLAVAAERTVGQLRRVLNRARIVVDPGAAQERHVAARAQRRVEFGVERDGMTGVYAPLPADAAAVLDATLDWRARATKTGGDGRSMDNRRADALCELVALGAGALDPSRLPDGVPNGSVGNDRVRPDGLANDGLANDGLANSGRTDGSVLGARRRWNRRAEVQVRVDASTLLGLDDNPGELAGHGPVPAAVARAIAADATWRRVLTDPVDGRVLEVGRTRYRPPAALDELVRVRDGTCRFPTCRQPAHQRDRVDLDHTVPYPDGPTAQFNLAGLCRRHHQLKQRPGWRVMHDPDGTMWWITPTGHLYRDDPES